MALEGKTTFKTDIATGTTASSGMFTYLPDASPIIFEGGNFSSVSAIDTTAINTFDFVISYNLDEGGANTIMSETCIVTKTY